MLSITTAYAELQMLHRNHDDKEPDDTFSVFSSWFCSSACMFYSM